ncbi:12005_t:CDS:2, partial [Gigaspora rosea]
MIFGAITHIRNATAFKGFLNKYRINILLCNVYPFCNSAIGWALKLDLINVILNFMEVDIGSVAPSDSVSNYEANYEANCEANYEANYEINYEANYEANHEENYEANHETNYET